MTELRIEKMLHQAKGLARLPDGRVALIKAVLPGELVRASLASHKGVLQGTATSILEASEARIPASEHPGLDYSHITYQRQLELKHEVITDVIARQLSTRIPVPVVTAAPSEWRYRNTVQPVVTRAGLGYRQPESHNVVLLAEDPVANAGIQAVWQHLQTIGIPKGIRELVIRANAKGEALLCLIAAASARNYLAFAHELLSERILGVSYAKYDLRGRFRSGSERLAGVRSLTETYGRYSVSMTVSSFAQPNPEAASLLYRRLEQLAPGGKRALDLYAGSGIIGMHLCRKYPEVIALDIDRGSVSRGQQDAERLGLALSFICADAKDVQIPDQLDLICVDPPRAGLNQQLRQKLGASRSPCLIYVSCDVATWARDVADFQSQGWTLQSLEAFDFYPQTHHIELLSVLTR